jgi:nitroimidazol reductase NimA-like FMN-containing flavoprotein (pyridoxamine 5'-phosphate oxidase superfamily)
VTTDFKPTARSRVKRLHKRAHYDRATIYAILDAGFICHVGYAIDGQPYVTPTAYWREGDHVYWHGSAASRMLRHLEKGVECCLTVTHLDGLVLARSGFHHSLEYRSAMLFGCAHKLTDPAEKLAKLESFINRIAPGRWDGLRPVNKKELKATTVLGMEIAEASAKVRAAGVIDDEEDYQLPIWAGVVPVRMVADPARDDGRLVPGTARPRHVESFTHLGLESE